MWLYKKYKTAFTYSHISTQTPQTSVHLLWQKHFLLIEVRILHKLRAPACIMLAIATLLTHKIYIAIATIYTHITYCRPHHLDGHSSKISQMSLQVDTINILATGVDCVPKSENAEKKLAGVYDHAHYSCTINLNFMYKCSRAIGPDRVVFYRATWKLKAPQKAPRAER